MEKNIPTNVVTTDYIEKLKKNGIRITRARKTILTLLASTKNHPDAIEIFYQASKIDKNISLSTVYRTMKVLEKTGTIQRHAFNGGPSRFEHIPRDHHDHLIDLDTGEVIEFTSDIIEQIQNEIALSLGYTIINHRLELYGRKCSAEKKDTPKKKNVL